MFVVIAILQNLFIFGQDYNKMGAANSISINKEKIDDSYSISVKNLICDKYILAQRGKKYYFIITID